MKFDSSFLNSSTQFAKDLYLKTIENASGNVVISPISIFTAVSFLTFGASGKTLDQMKSSLMFNEISNEDLEKNFQLLTENFEDGGLAMANKIYLKENYSIKPEFNEIATKSFQSEVESIDFGKKVEASENINQWVKSKTNNKIRDLMTPNALDTNTVLVLVNAIHFQALWQSPFTRIKIGPFYLNEEDSVQVSYMIKKSSFKFSSFEDLDATAVLLPYKESEVKMLIILPNSRTGLPALEGKLNEINFDSIIEILSMRSLELFFPEFKIEFDVDLEKPFKKMGMDVIFSNAAEFGNLLACSKPLKVSKVFHKAFIEVDEHGTEAGGATRIGGPNKVSLPKKFYPVQVDRPFLFALIEGSKLLFIGRKVK